MAQLILLLPSALLPQNTSPLKSQIPNLELRSCASPPPDSSHCFSPASSPPRRKVHLETPSLLSGKSSHHRFSFTPVELPQSPMELPTWRRHRLSRFSLSRRCRRPLPLSASLSLCCHAFAADVDPSAGLPSSSPSERYTEGGFRFLPGVARFSVSKVHNQGCRMSFFPLNLAVFLMFLLAHLQSTTKAVIFSEDQGWLGEIPQSAAAVEGVRAVMDLPIVAGRCQGGCPAV